MKPGIRIFAWPIAVLSMAFGIGGLISPDGGLALRRLYFSTPAPFYAMVALRSAMGLGLVVAASHSRWPRTLLALGTIVCLQGVSAAVLGLNHARAIMEWEGSLGHGILRAGAAAALCIGAFIFFAVTRDSSAKPRDAVSLKGS
jgi:hypothetical protein